jgi:hypothetical protein
MFRVLPLVSSDADHPLYIFFKTQKPKFMINYIKLSASCTMQPKVLKWAKFSAEYVSVILLCEYGNRIEQNCIFCWPYILVQFVLITKLMPFFNVFISLLYVFRASQCSSSGESIVSIHHLVYITPCRWPSDMKVSEEKSWPVYQTATYKEWYIPDDVLIQLILLMMSTGMLETRREVK